MLRRSFFATLFAPLVRRFRKPEPAVYLTTSQLNACQQLAELFFRSNPLFARLSAERMSGGTSLVEPLTYGDNKPFDGYDA